jgi:ubiquinone biosynthesis protein
MRTPSPTARLIERARAAGFEPQLQAFLHGDLPPAERQRLMLGALSSPAGWAVKDAFGLWIADTLAALVPVSTANWRSLVQDAMYFVVTQLSDARLAPKLVEQLVLPRRSSPERRLMRLIAQVPGLQKLGQVLARNRALQPALRLALTRLENGIRDMRMPELRAMIESQLGGRLRTYSVRIGARIVSEATVSAVVPFSWKNPITHERERGVFKVRKPFIPQFYSEDMDLLQGLAEYLKKNRRKYGVGARGLADTFREVRRLLQHEIDFRGEQRQLERAFETYAGMAGARVPMVIPPLCSEAITAMSAERGIKITRAVRGMSTSERRRIAVQAVHALISTPMLSGAEEAVFHADPHAGNLLYDRKTGELAILDWALVATVTLAQRRQLMILFLVVLLRDPVGIFDAVSALSLQHPLSKSRQRQIHATIDEFLRELPLSHMPDAMDAMSLLQKLAFESVRLPASLILLRKVMFTLEGILQDIVGGKFAMDRVLVRSLFWRWFTRKLPVGAPLETSDWLRIQASTLLSGTRWFLQAAQAIVRP